jgi:transcriptional regulator with XRE-family HTH domain
MSIEENIYKLRKKNNLSQGDLALKLVYRGNQYLNGKRDYLFQILKI